MKIVTDSGADMPSAEATRLGIAVAPLFIHFPEGEVDSASLTSDEFYDRLVAMEPHIPTTAQPSPGIFADLYRKVEASEHIYSVHISSGLSGTIGSARLGAQQVPGDRVTLFDSMTLSGGERFQVLAAYWAAALGWEAAAIEELLTRVRAATEVTFTLDTLAYLARGGRIGRVQALAGMLLHVKPVIRVDHKDGKYSTTGKARTLQQTLGLIVDELVKRYGDQPLWVTVLHGRLPERAKELEAGIRARLTVGHFECLRVSPVLGVHTGPGVVGAAVVPISLFEGIMPGEFAHPKG